MTVPAREPEGDVAAQDMITANKVRRPSGNAARGSHEHTLMDVALRALGL